MAPLKKQLAHEISRIIDSRNLTQTRAGAIAGEAPSQISLLMSGHLRGFSVERMLRTLLRLGQNVQLALTATPGLRRGKVTLVPAKGGRGR
jgi:predicted XRE-type DNA-binding protein